MVPSRWVWSSLTADEAADLWAELVEWVDWLRERMETDAWIKPCWFMHPPVVEELTLLMAGWKAALFVEGDEDAGEYPDAWGWVRSEPTAFMTHEFWPTLHRLPTVSDTSGCGADRCAHRPVPPRTLGSLGEYVAADVDARR